MSHKKSGKEEGAAVKCFESDSPVPTGPLQVLGSHGGYGGHYSLPNPPQTFSLPRQPLELLGFGSSWRGLSLNPQTGLLPAVSLVGQEERDFHLCGLGLSLLPAGPGSFALLFHSFIKLPTRCQGLWGEDKYPSACPQDRHRDQSKGASISGDGLWLCPLEFLRALSRRGAIPGSQGQCGPKAGLKVRPSLTAVPNEHLLGFPAGRYMIVGEEADLQTYSRPASFGGGDSSSFIGR